MSLRGLGIACAVFSLWPTVALAQTTDGDGPEVEAEEPGDQDAPSPPDDPPAIVRVAMMTDCAFDLAATLELLGTELAGDGIESVVEYEVPPEAEVVLDPSAAPDAIALVHLAPEPCAAPTEVGITIDDHATQKQVRRVFVLEDVDEDAQPRALAIGIAELLRASWAELALVTRSPTDGRFASWIRVRASTLRATPSPGEDRLDEHERRDSPPEPAPPPAEAAPVALDATLGVRGYPSGAAALIGGAVGASFRLGALPLSLRVAAFVGAGGADVRLGSIALGLAAGTVSLDLTSGPALPFTIAVGPSLELGGGWADGDPGATASGSSGSAFVVAVGGHVDLRAPLAGVFEAFVGLSGGYAVRGLEALTVDMAVTGLVGAYLDARIGVGVALGGVDG